MPVLAATASPRKSARNRTQRVYEAAQAMISAVDTRLAGKTASVAKPLFVGYETSISNWIFPGTRNADCWCADVAGITAISPWNSYGRNRHGGVLIARDVILMAYHANHPDGTVYSFVTPSNVITTRTQTASVRIGSTDIMLGKLDSDVGIFLKHAKVLTAADYVEFLALVSGGLRIPAISTNKEEEALVRDIDTLNTSATFRAPSDSKRLEFYETLEDGDSGSTGAWIYGSDLVMACSWHTGGVGAGPSVHHYRNEINAAMTSLGSAYQLTELIL